MNLHIQSHLDYFFAAPTDVLLQLEAAATPEQTILSAHIDVAPCARFTRIAGQDGIGDRIWVRAEGQMVVQYEARIAIRRALTDCLELPRVEPPALPSETIQYLMGSRYCQSDSFHAFVEAEFAGLDGGARVIAMRDWIEANFSYVAGVSNSETTAMESFVQRQGICRDYAHVMITLARAAGIPARIASVYALGVEPQDFHAVAEVFLAGDWHLVDATGMAQQDGMAVIGVGRDAADVSFMTSYGNAAFNNQWVSVRAGD